MYVFFFYILEIAGLSRSNNLEKKKFFKRHACYLVIAAWSSNFFHHLYNALDTFAPKIKFLVNENMLNKLRVRTGVMLLNSNSMA